MDELVENVVSIHQGLPADPCRDGCGWNSTFSLTIPTAWKSGLYSALLVSPTTNGEYFHITFVVKPQPIQHSRIAVIANVNTWNAYNNWNGFDNANPKSKYRGLAKTSFLRPNPSASPVGDESPNHHLARAERWILGWLEDNGYTPDLYTDIDYHDGNVSIAGGYRKIVIGTHPEYWTTMMRARLDKFVEQGGSVVYLGGNGIFETLTYSEDRKNATYRLGLEIPSEAPPGQPNFLANFDIEHRAPAMFRVMGPHERNLLGVATAKCSAPGAAYTVRLPNHPVFAWTGLPIGGQFGADGFNTSGGSLSGGASGHEIDTSCDADTDSLPCGITSMLEIQRSKAPRNLCLLAVGQGGLGAHMTFYRHPRGGFVFSVGSITFGGSLVYGGSRAHTPIQRIVRNVMDMN